MCSSAVQWCDPRTVGNWSAGCRLSRCDCFGKLWIQPADKTTSPSAFSRHLYQSHRRGEKRGTCLILSFRSYSRLQRFLHLLSPPGPASHPGSIAWLSISIPIHLRLQLCLGTPLTVLLTRDTSENVFFLFSKPSLLSLTLFGEAWPLLSDS